MIGPHRYEPSGLKKRSGSGRWPINAKFESLDSEEFAVLDPQGKLVVYSLEMKRPILESDIEPETALADLQVFRTADRYVVLVARQLTYRQGMAHMYPVQNVGAARCAGGRGASVWFRSPQRKADLDGQKLWTDQHARQSARPFAPHGVCHEHERATAAGGQKASTNVSVLDTRNGRVFGPHKVDNGSSTDCHRCRPRGAVLGISLRNGHGQTDVRQPKELTNDATPRPVARRVGA